MGGGGLVAAISEGEVVVEEEEAPPEAPILIPDWGLGLTPAIPEGQVVVAEEEAAGWEEVGVGRAVPALVPTGIWPVRRLIPAPTQARLLFPTRLRF